MQKSAFIALVGKNQVDGLDVAFFGAVIAFQLMPVLLIDLVADFQVGADIAAAEAIDGLLGVANYKTGPLLSGLDKQALKDFPLQRVSVLELVDKRGLEFIAYALA